MLRVMHGMIVKKGRIRLRSKRKSIINSIVMRRIRSREIIRFQVVKIASRGNGRSTSNGRDVRLGNRGKNTRSTPINGRSVKRMRKMRS